MLAPDLLPHGPPVTQLSRWADAAAAQIVAAGGGPALVSSLVLDSAQLGGPPPPLVLRRLGCLLGAVAGRLPARLAATALLSQFLAYHGEDRTAVRADILRLGVAGTIGHLRAQLAHDVRPEAANIIAPVLLLAGESSPLTRSGVHRSLQGLITQARLVVVPGAGRVTFLSHPEAILRELLLWLDQHRHEL